MTFACPDEHFLGFDRNRTSVTLKCNDDGTGKFDEWPVGAVCYNASGKASSDEQ